MRHDLDSAASHRYSLFAALKQTELERPDRARLGDARRRRDETVTITQAAHVTFAPSDVRVMEPAQAGRTRIEQYSFGLFGPNGALPLHLSQLAIERQIVDKDGATVAFLDVFHHRLASLFFRAWADSEPTVNVDAPADDPVGTVLGALAGVDSPAAAGRDGIPSAAKWRAALDLGRPARSPERLQALLAQHLRVPVTVRPFAGAWLRVPDSDRCRVRQRGETAQLGAGATLGAESWQRAHRFEVVIGPLDANQFQSLLPGRAALRTLTEWIRLYTHDEWDWVVRLVARTPCCHAAVLGGGAQLGWSSWLGTRRGEADDVTLHDYDTPTAPTTTSGVSA
jgi:type VI secretion system protein ImpH